MAIVTRILNNTGDPISTPDGSAAVNQVIVLQLVDQAKRQPVSCFDAVTGEYITGKAVEVTTDVFGIFSVDLWPNNRSELATLYKVTLLNSHMRPFYIRITEGDGSISLLEAKVAVDAISPQVLSLFDTLLSDMIAQVNTATEPVTQTSNGLMLAADKEKLDNLTAGGANPAMNGVAAPGISIAYARQDHVHPTDTSRASAAQGMLADSALQPDDIWISVQPFNANTVTAITNSIATISSTTAASATAVKTAYDLATSKLSDAPSDGSQYARKNGGWAVVAAGGATVTVTAAAAYPSASDTTAASPAYVSAAIQTVTASSINAASAAQGTKADNALQGIIAENYATLALADAAAVAAGKWLIVSTQWNVVPATINAFVKVLPGGKFNNAGAVTFAGRFECGLFQCFIGAGAANFSTMSEVYPEWWGKDIAKAVTSLPTSGGKVMLQSDIYSSPFNSNAAKLTKDNIAFVGTRMPELNSTSTALVNGTIIRDTFWIYANNISVQDLGVDVGSANFATSRDGLLIAADISHPAATAPWKGFRAENIRVLARNANDAYHAFLCEYVTRAYVKNIHTKFNWHGIVFKAIYSTAHGLYATDHGGEGVIIKADSYANCYHSNFSLIEISNSTAGSGNGLMLNGASASLTHINVSGVSVNNATTGIVVVGSSGASVEDCHISNANVTSSQGNGVHVQGYTSYITVSNASSNSNAGAGFVSIGSFTTFDKCSARSNVGIGFDIQGTSCRITRCTARTGQHAGLNLVGAHWVSESYFPTTDVEGPGGVTYGAGGRMIGDVSAASVIPTLLNGWANWGGGTSPARYIIDNGRVRLAGLVRAGTIGQAMFTLPDGIRPTYVFQQAVTCNNGSTSVHGQIAIDTSGNVILEYGATNYVSLAGIEFSLGLD